ncbi:hypothetical protein [Herbaspirillum sp. B65]|uniref:hypothetical protein n=1 Tax=Herbaspirillum sp. B65 TaxID=137708 RepID=UPI0005C96799|nr:hypothetical protein [Herbaspirillum sp. B65]
MDVKVIARQSLMHGRLNLRKGEVVEIPEAIAAELERVSLVKRVETEPVAPVAPTKGSTANTRTSRSKKEPAPAPAGDANPNVPQGGTNANSLIDGAQGGQEGILANVVQTSAQAPVAAGDQEPPPDGMDGAVKEPGADGGEGG